MKKGIAVTLAVLTACACSRRSEVQPEGEVRAPAIRGAAAPTARQPTVDPRSSAAAENLVRIFAQMLASGRSDEAYMLLSPNAPPRKSFDDNLASYRDLHVEVGSAGDQEGAAGSIYVTVPLTVSGIVAGKHVNRRAKAIVRRVNDVPGSTEAQRHWHIERIDWGG